LMSRTPFRHRKSTLCGYFGKPHEKTLLGVKNFPMR